MNKKQILSIIFWTPICTIFFTFLPFTGVQATENTEYCENVYMRLGIDKEAIDYPECNFEAIGEEINRVILLNNRN